MKDRQKGIDLFRLIAAIMVIAIHTFPFYSLSPSLDELITLTIFRVAVPFFFMTTGFFLIGNLSLKRSYYELKKVKLFIIKISKIYGVTILIYLPFSIMNGTVQLDTSLLNWVKLLLFDGSFYHLWYFPGIIIGVLLVTLLLKYASFNQTFLISFLLYLIGVGGDSWYGMISRFSEIGDFYAVLFRLMEMTRTGIFFTPLFLCLGAFIFRNQKEKSMRQKEEVILLSISFLILILESFLLRYFSTIKHDSMYLSLPIVMYFLFLVLLQWEPKMKTKHKSEFSLVVYIVHPLVIMIVHFLSNQFPLLKLSWLYFLLVVIGSILLSDFIIECKKKFLPKKKKEIPYRAERELSASAISHNLLEINRIIPEKTRVMAVVKANAYGMDMVEFAKLLVKNQVTFLAVATIDEGIKLRKAMIPGNILILGYTASQRIKEIEKYDLIQSIVSQEHAEMLNAQKTSIRCHLQVDTGMHRLGLEPNVDTIIRMYQLKYLRIEGIYSHLGSSDSLEDKAVARTEKQLITYCNILNALKKKNINYGLTHIQSSYGVLNYSEYAFDYVRVGIILYGFLSSEASVAQRLDLKPVVQLKAKIISKRLVKAGEYLGYGTDTQLSREMLVGVVSIGYADGIPRSLSSNNYGVYYQDRFLPQIGNICMDMLLVNLDEVKDIQLNAEVIVASDFQQMAISDETITNEILSQLGSRLSTSISR